MTRRTFCQTAAAAPLVRPAGSRPNILFLMADQLRGDCLGADGNRVIRTPNLDRLATEGVRFRHAYTSMASCTPARTALLTGLSPWHHGMLGMIGMAERYPLEKPRALAEAGYHTCAIGKMHFNPMRNSHGYQRMIVDEHCACGNFLEPRKGEERTDYESWFWSQAPSLNPHATGLGWNDYRGRPFALPERLHPTVWTGDTAVNFLNGYKGPEPFLLKVSFIRPHSPYDPPERFVKMYEDAPLPEPHVAPWASRFEQRNSDKADIWRGKLPANEVRRARQAYYGCVTQVDEQIGRILEAIDKRGWLDETLILFTSDHGDMTGDHNLWRKSYPWESSSRIPMLMRWPTGLIAAPRGQVRDEPVELRDVLPTFLEAVGVELTRKIDGASLLRLASGKNAGWREYLDMEHIVGYEAGFNWNGLTDGRWKYIYQALDGEEQLFNLERDPHEMRNLASEASHEPELRRWRARLVEHFAERGEPFLKNGKLATRERTPYTSPHFPGGQTGQMSQPVTRSR